MIARGRTCLLLTIGLVGLLAACSLGGGPSAVAILEPPAAPPHSLAEQPAGVVAVPALTALSSPEEPTFDGEEQRFIELFQETNPSVVHIRVDRPAADSTVEELRRRLLRVQERAGFRGNLSHPDGGSGFVLDEDGLILTTNRVVSAARDIRVTFADGTESRATVVGFDPNTDLAVLRVRQLPASAQPLALGDSDGLRVGQRVVAVGNPLGYGGMMTAGVVSAKARNVSVEIAIDRGFFTAPDLIQTDAVILGGTVGGPLLNLTGQVIGVLGIDTLEFDAASGTRAGGVGFSIPTSTVRRVVPVLLEEGRYPYPWLGISATDLDPDLAEAMGLSPERRGVLIRDVTPGSPADKAGLRGSEEESPGLGPLGGDVVTAFEGRPVGDFDELVSLLFREGNVGEAVVLTILRDGEEIEVPMILEERPR